MKWFHLILVIGCLYIGYILYEHINDTVYYLWDKTKDAVLMATISSLLRRRYESKFVIRVSQASTAFIICRVVIEYLILLFPSLDTPAAFDFMFYLSWAVVLYVILFNAITAFMFKLRIYCSYIVYLVKNLLKKHA